MREGAVGVFLDKHRKAGWRAVLPGVQDAGLASGKWKDSSKGMGQE